MGWMLNTCESCSEDNWILESDSSWKDELIGSFKCWSCGKVGLCYDLDEASEIFVEIWADCNKDQEKFEQELLEYPEDGDAMARGGSGGIEKLLRLPCSEITGVQGEYKTFRGFLYTLLSTGNGFKNVFEVLDATRKSRLKAIEVLSKRMHTMPSSGVLVSFLVDNNFECRKIIKYDHTLKAQYSTNADWDMFDRQMVDILKYMLGVY